MMPGTAPISPLSITDRLVVALDQLRSARTDGDPSREWAYQEMFDTLIDRYAEGLR